MATEAGWKELMCGERIDRLSLDRGYRHIGGQGAKRGNLAGLQIPKIVPRCVGWVSRRSVALVNAIAGIPGAGVD